jgi:hypothetical protein
MLLSGDQAGRACLATHAGDLQRIWSFLKQTTVTFRLHFTFPENFNHITSPVRDSENFNEIKSTMLYSGKHFVPGNASYARICGPRMLDVTLSSLSQRQTLKEFEFISTSTSISIEVKPGCVTILSISIYFRDEMNARNAVPVYLEENRCAANEKKTNRITVNETEKEVLRMNKAEK